MANLDRHQLARVAEDYEALLVPPLFGAWAPAVADASRARRGQAVLDVACGTGALTRRLAERVLPAGLVCGLDVNPGMLDVAARHEPAVDWREGDATALPFEDAHFDVVTCQFGLMLFDDPDAALREQVRVLRSGGRLVVAVFDDLSHQPGYSELVEVYTRCVGPEVGALLAAPFGLGDGPDLVRRLAAAGAEDVRLETAVRPAGFTNVAHLVAADVDGWFPFAQVDLDASTRTHVTEEVGSALAPFLRGEGAVEFPVSVHVATATRG